MDAGKLKWREGDGIETEGWKLFMVPLELFFFFFRQLVAVSLVLWSRFDDGGLWDGFLGVLVQPRFNELQPQFNQPYAESC